MTGPRRTRATGMARAAGRGGGDPPDALGGDPDELPPAEEAGGPEVGPEAHFFARLQTALIGTFRFRWRELSERMVADRGSEAADRNARRDHEAARARREAERQAAEEAAAEERPRRDRPEAPPEAPAPEPRAETLPE